MELSHGFQALAGVEVLLRFDGALINGCQIPSP